MTLNARFATPSRTPRSATSNRRCQSRSGSTADSPASTNGARCSVDPKDKRGWPTFFADGARACAGLQRLHESIESQSAPQAGRSLYADFLDDAARTLDAPALANAAATYREAGVLWASIGDIVSNCDDAAVRKACGLADERLEAEEGDDGGSLATPLPCADRWQELQNIAAGCTLSKSDTGALYAEIASVVGRIADAERAAVALLNEGVRSPI